MNDLFGNPVSDRTLPTPTGEKRKHSGMARGYAGTPGRGPQGHFCRDCKHAYCRSFSKRYWKCNLVKPTGGPATDIRLKSPACQFWEAKV